ncbi:YdcF family protein [Muricoccus radiodurans]|uniref:YdcF family protein n=1 Tax=Muricoccus radiodurans TaxID=2231721 RepID=UPI003CEC439F
MRPAGAAGAEEALPDPFMGADGVFTLLLAAVVAALSLGVAPALALRGVLRAARAEDSPVMPPARVLVLGARLRGGVVGAAFRARLDRALALAAADPALVVVVLGGPTEPGHPPEAEAGRDYLIAAGLAPDRIRTETRSRHTLENLRQLRATLPPGEGPDLLVTSRSHLARASRMATVLGLPHHPCAAEPRGRLPPGELLREALLLHWYDTGHAFARMTRNRRMLARLR